jgi:chromosome segregation ATPase
MAWQDEVAQLRGQKLADKQAADAHNESVEAVKDSGSDIISALLDTDGTTKKVEVVNNSEQATSKDIASITQELRQLQLDTLMSAQQQAASHTKPTVILTDQTDLGDKIDGLTSKLVEAIKGLDDSEQDAKEIQELKGVVSSLTVLKKSIDSGNSDLKKSLDSLTKSIKALGMNPTVNVPETKIPKVDLKPLQATLEQYLSKDEDDEDGIDLDDYYAQDIDNTNPDMQYVGFVNPEGNWYIIENDVKGNKLRYVFGTLNYEEAFAQASMFTYMLLNEAINAIPA